MKLTVIDGGRRDASLRAAEERLKEIIAGGATIKIEGKVLVFLQRARPSLTLTQLRGMLKRRCRVKGIEPSADPARQILLVQGMIAEELEEENFTAQELSLKMVVEAPKTPGYVAIVDIGQLGKREESWT